jgi:hypothetical protein
MTSRMNINDLMALLPNDINGIQYQDYPIENFSLKPTEYQELCKEIEQLKNRLSIVEDELKNIKKSK